MTTPQASKTAFTAEPISMAGAAPFKEIIEGMTIAGLAWGDEQSDYAPIIALHGWLDNAASFARIGPLLAEQGFYVLALDLPGHGESSHRPPFGTYNLWDDLLILHTLIEKLCAENSWSHYHLLGHSRGAMISTLSASAMPDKVLSLQALDGLLPETVSVEKTPEQLQKHIKEYMRVGRKRLPTYASLEDAISARCKATGMSREAARPIVQRGVKKGEDGRYIWRSDIRLTAASAIKFTDEHCQAVLKGITVPFQMLMAEGGMGLWREFGLVMEQYPHLPIHRISGDHHFHLDDAAQELAERVGSFIKAL